MTSLLDHLKCRHMDVALHHPLVSDEEQLATFYLWNLSGQLVGYQQYRPNGDKKKFNNPKEGRYFTYKKQQTVTVWGVESLHLSPKVLFVTEGIFDAVRLTKRGFSAVAVLSNNPPNDYRNWFMSLSRKVIAVCDSDEAGKRLAKFGNVAFFTKEKDLGDSTEEEVTYLIEKFTTNWRN